MPSSTRLRTGMELDEVVAKHNAPPWYSAALRLLLLVLLGQAVLPAWPRDRDGGRIYQ